MERFQDAEFSWHWCPQKTVTIPRSVCVLYLLFTQPSRNRSFHSSDPCFSVSFPKGVGYARVYCIAKEIISHLSYRSINSLIKFLVRHSVSCCGSSQTILYTVLPDTVRRQSTSDMRVELSKPKTNSIVGYLSLDQFSYYFSFNALHDRNVGTMSNTIGRRVLTDFDTVRMLCLGAPNILATPNSTSIPIDILAKQTLSPSNETMYMYKYMYKYDFDVA